MSKRSQMKTNILENATEEQSRTQALILNSLKTTTLDLQIVLLEKEMNLGQLVSLSPGSILTFDKPVSSPAHLYVNAKKFAKGTVVQVAERYGLKLTELIP